MVLAVFRSIKDHDTHYTYSTLHSLNLQVQIPALYHMLYERGIPVIIWADFENICISTSQALVLILDLIDMREKLKLCPGHEL